MKKTLPILAIHKKIGIKSGSFGMNTVPTQRNKYRTYLMTTVSKLPVRTQIDACI